MVKSRIQKDPTYRRATRKGGGGTSQEVGKSGLRQWTM